MQTLSGLTVVALEQAVAAPFASRQLADLGARVIKIERPGTGDFARQYDRTVNGLSSHFVWLNRSKESLTLDVKTPEAKDILDRLLSKADVFIQNLAPGAAERLGLGAQWLRKTYPRLIVCEISGYGSGGPYDQKKAYDLLIQSEAGLVSITGTTETPSKVGISIADIAAGMYAYSGILTALFERERSGEGAVIEVSLLEALGEWMGYALYYTAYSGAAPERTGASHAAIAPYGPFPCGDGKVIYLAIQNEREWQSFCEAVLQCPALGVDPRFASNSERVQHRGELNRVIEDVFRHSTADEITCRLEGAQVATAQLNTVQEFWDHPQLAARDRWRTVGSPVGTLRALLPPVTLKGSAEAVMGPIPGLGEHAEQILLELGYSRDTIQDWRGAGVI